MTTKITRKVTREALEAMVNEAIALPPSQRVVREYRYKSGRRRAVVLNYAAVLSRWGARRCHLLFLRTDGTLGKLCSAPSVLRRREGWILFFADVEKILHTPHHSAPSESAIADGYLRVGDHYLCTNCEMTLDLLHRIANEEPLTTYSSRMRWWHPGPNDCPHCCYPLSKCVCVEGWADVSEAEALAIHGFSLDAEFVEVEREWMAQRDAERRLRALLMKAQQAAQDAR